MSHSEPEFTNTRICLVQYLLSSAQLFDDATDQKGKHDFISKEVN